jgi:hypothetical protein
VFYVPGERFLPVLDPLGVSGSVGMKAALR